ncbi:MAG TPA: pilus assembly protein TadG-related protein [Acidimicrobiia bacterium]|nr:pilus assembly protein TadG-related protein [Acidimicrobiia bacterium]
MSVGRDSERGATAILVAICLLLLMGMAALAIDISAAKNERRLDQNGADSSVLAGALEYALGGSAQSVVDEAKLFVDNNVRIVPGTDWTACVDPQALAVLSSSIPGITGGSGCISFQFGPDDALMRVRVPNQQTGTSFGRVLGVNQIATFAAAEATIFETANGSFPAGVFAGASGGDEFCIKTGSAGGRDSCGGSTTGDFGSFQPYFYTEFGIGPQTSLCASGNAPAPLSRSMADGLDHRLGTTPTQPGTRENGDDCPGFPGPLNPNRVDSGGGYSNNDITDGLVMGGRWPGNSDLFTGRLTRGPYVGQVDAGTGGVFSLFGRSLDNRPLWTYIDPTEADSVSCQRAAEMPGTPSFPFSPSSGPAIADWAAAEDLMQQCLAQETDLLFTSDIANTHRLSSVPQYHQATALGSNACCYDIRNFVPIFIQGLWTNEGPQWTCNGVTVVSGSHCQHDPGMQGSISIAASGQQKVDSASALVIDCNQLPVPVCQSVAGSGAGDNAFFVLELTR